MTKLVLISHFYNEEFLLPYWLEHNLKIFDHAVLIDYQSTDASVDIIKDMAPDWEIRPSRNTEFDAYRCDTEVIDIEKEFSGYWKSTVNVTEFLVCGNLKALCERFEAENPDIMGFHVHGGDMIDRIEDRYDSVTDEPLIFQKHYGCLDGGMAGARNRIIHRQDYGYYSTGRHFFGNDEVLGKMWTEAYCMWFGFCPVEYVRERALQIQTRMSAQDKNSGLGVEHLMTEEMYEEKYLTVAGFAQDLLEDDGYRAQLEAMKREAYGQS